MKYLHQCPKCGKLWGHEDCVWPGIRLSYLHKICIDPSIDPEWVLSPDGRSRKSINPDGYWEE